MIINNQMSEYQEPKLVWHKKKEYFKNLIAVGIIGAGSAFIIAGVIDMIKGC